jgi:hypothetical protein
MNQLAYINNLMSMDGLIILVLGLLFFGRRLPEVGRNLSREFRDFPRHDAAKQIAMASAIVVMLIVLLKLAAPFFK